MSFMKWLLWVLLRCNPNDSLDRPLGAWSVEDKPRNKGHQRKDANIEAVMIGWVRGNRFERR
jgi:hypothetical protein